MFRAAYRSSSGALNCICSLCFTYTCGVVKAEWEMDPLPAQPWQRPVTTCVCKPEAANTVYSSWWWAVCRSKHGKWIHFPLSLDNGRPLHVYANQRPQIQFRAPDDERYAARNMGNGSISHSALTTAGHHTCMQTRGRKYSLEFLMMSGMPLETWEMDPFPTQPWQRPVTTHVCKPEAANTV